MFGGFESLLAPPLQRLETVPTGWIICVSNYQYMPQLFVVCARHSRFEWVLTSKYDGTASATEHNAQPLG